MYLRFKGADAVAKAESVFGKITSLTTAGGARGALLTGNMCYGEFLEKSEALKAQGVEIMSSIRIGDL